MNFLKTGLISLCIILLVSACATTDKTKKNKKTRLTKKEYLEALKPKLSKISPAEAIEAKKLAMYHAENFYKGLKNKDYAVFNKSKKLDKKNFNNWCNAVTRKYGKLESQKYLGVKPRALSMQYIWKWVFKEKMMNESIQRDILFSVRIVKFKKDKKCSLLVVGFE